jgi:Na+/proline symporter
MLGILFIYFIGKAFYTLAEENDKKRWLWAILGVLSYYVGSAVLGALLLITFVLLGMNIDFDNINQVPEILLALIGGGLSCTGFYFILKRQWEKKASGFDDFDDTILDDI